MLAHLQTSNGVVLTLQKPFRDFLAGSVMRKQAGASFCSPEVLVFDYLPDIDDPEDDDEVAQAFAEAAEQASGDVVSHVRLDRADLKFIRRRLAPGFGWQLLDATPETAA